MKYDSEHFKKYEMKLEKARLNKASYMNDTKWEKFFQAVENSNINEFDVSGSMIKFLADDKIRPFRFQDYWGDYLEGSYGPARYKEIEWILIPAVYEIKRFKRDEKLEPKRANNDIHAMKELIDSLGLYEYDFNEDGLKIYGYK